jgi:hypothetical protein
MSRKRGLSVLVTVLFTDIVGSTEIAAELGDRRWRDPHPEGHCREYSLDALTFKPWTRVS